MPDPVQFTSSTPRFSLPFLFAGQAQKEFLVNEAHALTDFLLHPAVEATELSPPSDPQSGQAWIIAESATGDWAGRATQIAAYQVDGWLYILPQIGMQIFDKASKQFAVFDGQWQKPSPPKEALGGQTVDAELREAFVGLVESLKIAGIYSAIE
ncbi:hypothetical protein GCM10023115_02650 [Pontixanthobacter gangjinensis]|uniref:DUF2793 domain-containing protein n=1 Tax=Pontixanthobacter gangjinensis TaxID=1028742 RepID=A0A6I4SJC1_9SPHN|nr:DUF2793 domain-containing protein [Pontixanthobacter gangjinensis]MXO55518.1 DUF2793 domain-containing protein [Pontixanthobacter gangjinensis]